MFTREQRQELDQAIDVLRTMAGPAFDVGAPADLAPASAEAGLEPATRLDGVDAYQTLVEQIPAVTFLAPLDASANQVYVSPQIEQLLGYTQREWMEDPVLWYERLHDDDKQRWTEDAARTFSAGTALDGTYRFLARDGSVVWIYGHVKIVHDVAGHPQFMHGVGFDVTESKLAEIERARLREELEARVAERTAQLSQAQQELEGYAAELERSNEDLERFASIASHDLQEPLRTLASYSQLLEEELELTGALSEDQRHYLRFISDASGHMRQLVADLLSLSRVGKSELRSAPTDLRRVVKEILQLLGDRIQRTGAVVTVDDLGEVLADERLLAQALQNLIANALKFCDRESPQVYITCERTQTEVIIGVKDNGIGIDSRHFDMIFQPFKRLHKSRYEGTGIGLAICKKIIDLHRGRLWVESMLGQGAHFKIALPAG